VFVQALDERSSVWECRYISAKDRMIQASDNIRPSNLHTESWKGELEQPDILDCQFMEGIAYSP
jgi:hypothetical protein